MSIANSTEKKMIIFKSKQLEIVKNHKIVTQKTGEVLFVISGWLISCASSIKIENMNY